MGGIFSRPSAPPPPKKTEDTVSRAEQAADAQESRKKLEIARKSRARTTGGQRMLLGERGATGVEFETTNTLGYGRNPRT
tara:strand:- start:8002 stop:8241 length:240 start_codon:yes stop_codon:yes gene_type:complete